MKREMIWTLIGSIVCAAIALVKIHTLGSVFFVHPSDQFPFLLLRIFVFIFTAIFVFFAIKKYLQRFSKSKILEKIILGAFYGAIVGALAFAASVLVILIYLGIFVFGFSPFISDPVGALIILIWPFGAALLGAVGGGWVGLFVFPFIDWVVRKK